MPQDFEYAPTIEDLLLGFFREQYKDLFNSYIDGDPIVFGRSMLPAIIVQETTNTSDLGPSGYDDTVHTIEIKVVFDKRDEYGKDQAEIGLRRKVKNLIEARLKSNNQFAPNTMKYLLRMGFTLENNTYFHIDQTNYNTVSRPQDQITEEGQITLTLNTLDPVPTRT